MTAQEEDFFHFGVVSGVHGLRGDLKVRPRTADSTSLLDAGEIFFRRGETVQAHAPVRVSPHKGGLLLRLEGLDSIEAVQPLVGCDVLMRIEDLDELPEDEFYWFELEGMTVFDETLGELGTLEELLSTAAHDIYVVRGAFGEVLIPAVDKFVTEIDRAARRMTVDLPEGLVPEPE